MSQKLSLDFPQFEFIFTDSNSLDITDKEAVLHFFWQNEPSVCINAAAYTAVDLAETEVEKAFLVNADGTENLPKLVKNIMLSLFTFLQIMFLMVKTICLILRKISPIQLEFMVLLNYLAKNWL
jgi:FlaA1/EpsC-like NDP-sugar epimerase